MIYTGITKNQAFNVLMVAYSSSDNRMPEHDVRVTSSYIRISKDGGAWNLPTNGGVVTLRGSFTLLLTAEEMNADRIDIIAQNDNSIYRFISAAVIFTTSGGGGDTVTVSTASEDSIVSKVRKKLMPFLK